MKRLTPFLFCLLGCASDPQGESDADLKAGARLLSDIALSSYDTQTMTMRLYDAGGGSVYVSLFGRPPGTDTVTHCFGKLDVGVLDRVHRLRDAHAGCTLELVPTAGGPLVRGKVIRDGQILSQTFRPRPKDALVGRYEAAQGTVLQIFSSAETEVVFSVSRGAESPPKWVAQGKPGELPEVRIEETPDGPCVLHVNATAHEGKYSVLLGGARCGIRTGLYFPM